MLRRYWSDRLGVNRDAFDRSGVTVGSGSRHGIELFERGDALVVGAPELLVPALRRYTDDLASIDVTDPDAVRGAFTDLGFGPIGDVLGPAFYGYADRETFAPVESDARVLTADDESAYRHFRGAVPDEEWKQGGPAFEPGEMIGLFADAGDDNELVAAAAYDVWDDLLAHLAVVASPERRNQGYGRAVVSRATERALAEGLIPQYRTADAWPWSVALAEGLGFCQFGTSVLVSIGESP